MMSAKEAGAKVVEANAALGKAGKAKQIAIDALAATNADLAKIERLSVVTPAHLVTAENLRRKAREQTAAEHAAIVAHDDAEAWVNAAQTELALARLRDISAQVNASEAAIVSRAKALEVELGALLAGHAQLIVDEGAAQRGTGHSGRGRFSPFTMGPFGATPLEQVARAVKLQTDKDREAQRNRALRPAQPAA